MRPASAGGGHALEGLLLADLQARSSTWQHAAAVAAAGISCCSPEIGWVAGVGLGAGLGQGSRVEAGRGGGVLLHGGRGRGRGDTGAKLPAGAGGEVEIGDHLQ